MLDSDSRDTRFPLSPIPIGGPAITEGCGRATAYFYVETEGLCNGGGNRCQWRFDELEKSQPLASS